jgi:hypothetical protein
MRTVRYALLLVLMTLVRIEAESTPKMKELEAAQERLKHVGDHVDRNGNRIDREKDPWVLAGHRRTQLSIDPKAELVATPTQSTAVARPIPVETPTPPYPVITTQEEYDRLPVGISFLWRDKLLKKQTPTPHVAPVTTPVITLLLIAIVIVLLVWKTTFFWLKPKAYPQREPVERHPQIHSDYGHYQLALKRWEGDRQVFEKSESDRLAALGAWASKGGPLTALAFLVGVVVTIFAANRVGSGAGWAAGLGCLISVGAVMIAEEHFRRWRHHVLFVRQEFSEPAPIYVPPAQPPPRNEPSLERTRVDPSIEKVTTMRQAYANLGIAPGRISIDEVRKIYRNLQKQYHPDRVAHLGKEIQELAARRALSFNLAMKFVEENYKKRS